VTEVPPALPQAHELSASSGADASPQGGRGKRWVWIASGAVVLAAVGVYWPILYHMGVHWSVDSNYSHGFLVLPLSAYFAWERRAALARATPSLSWWGLPLLIAGVLALAVGRLGVEQMSMRVGFVLTLNGLVLFLLGRDVYRLLLFPLWFLVLMVPLPQSLVNVIAFPLQLFAADLAVNVLQSLAIPVLREGNIIHMPETQLFVAEACSGLRSLLALLTLGVVFAYFFRRSWIERVILVASTIPIAILVNAFRVALTALLTHYYGAEMAEGTIHMTEGFFTFGLAFVLLLGEAALLSRLFSGRQVGRPGGATS